MSVTLAPDEAGVRRAAQALRRGELVVFPTETVYGVGADARDAAAVARIFEAKGRPADNPLIVHVADAQAARALARSWPEAAERLARAFWPGPLALVLPRAEDVPDVTTGGLDSVAVRVPDHPVALALLREAGVPVAAPSANRSGRPSPTRVADAAEDLGAAVAVYLDGGPARVGVESTVVSLMEEAPRILRPGGIPAEAVQHAAGALATAPAAEGPARAPGMKYRHYAPRARVVLAASPRERDAVADRLRAEGFRVAVVAGREHAPPEGPDVRVPGGLREAEAWARQLFALLRDLDRAGYDTIVVEAIPEEGVGAAVMNRLRKAAESASAPEG